MKARDIMTEKDKHNLKKLSLKVAGTLTIRLLEKRFTNIENTPEIFLFFGEKCYELLESFSPEGYPALTMASNISSRLIEAGRISNKDAILRNLYDNMVTLENIAQNIPFDLRNDVLKIAVDMVLKMLETVTISTTSIPNTLQSVAKNAYLFLKDKEEKEEK
jgi:hypothetical protein